MQQNFVASRCLLVMFPFIITVKLFNVHWILYYNIKIIYKYHPIFAISHELYVQVLFNAVVCCVFDLLIAPMQKIDTLAEK